MLEVILDTETTGLLVAEKHKIVEIGCIELENQIPTNRIFHEYINPQRQVSKEAFNVHGYTDEFLSDKDNLANSSTSRRDFLKYIGFSTAAATLAACEGPVVKSIPYVVKPKEIIPKDPTHIYIFGWLYISIYTYHI